MEFDFQHLLYNHEKGEFIVFGESTLENPTFVLRQKTNKRDFEFESEIELEVKRIENNYIVKIDLESILKQKNYPDETIWILLMVTESDEYIINVNDKYKNNMNYYHHVDYIFRVKPYITIDNSIAFFVKGLNLNFYSTNITYKNGVLCSLASVEGENLNYLADKRVSLVMRKVSPSGLPFYDEIIEDGSLKVLNNQIFIETNISEKISIKDNIVESNWDINLYIYDKNENKAIYSLRVKEKEVNQKFPAFPLLNNKFYRIKPYVTGDKNLAVYLSEKHNNVVLNEISESMDIITVHVGCEFKEEYKDCKLVIKKRDKAGMNFEYYDHSSFPLEKDEKGLYATIDKNDFLSDFYLKDNQTWDFFVRFIDSKSNYIDVIVNVPKELKRNFDYFEMKGKNDRLKAKLYINGSSKLSLFVRYKEKEDASKLKVAVLGTCFSRNAFNSSSYFNPGYKDTFDCVFTQFHSSLISLVSNEVKLDLSLFTDINKTDLEFLTMDFKKTFFLKLKELNVDYLVLDLYPDACRSVLQLEENQYVTASYILERSRFIRSLPITKVIDHSNNEEYFALWKNAAEIFVGELIKILPEERIILNKGRFTSTYFDKNREVKSFRDTDLIRRNNYFWEKIDNYFISLLPNVKVIDLTDQTYIGDINYPFGLSFSHYQSEYYKEFLKRLNNIVIRDYISMIH